MAVDFGRYVSYYHSLNEKHHDICWRLAKFAEEAGEDPYGRKFFAEPLIDFALVQKITEKTAEEIYREYVYWKLAQVDYQIAEPYESLLDRYKEDIRAFEEEQELLAAQAEFCILD